MSWDSTAKAATCSTCSDPPVAAVIDAPAAPEKAAPAIDRGVAGASARRKSERDGERERHRKEAVVARDAEWRNAVVDKHPIVGRVATMLTPKPVVGPESTSVRNWRKGAEGEELVGPILDGCPNVIVLHDRRVPNSKANIDHLAIAPSGIYVIDPKNYDGTVERRLVGGIFNSEERLYVRGRNRTDLVDKLHWQITEVRKAFGDDPMPIYGLLCFVGPNWRRFFTRPLSVQGTKIMWPARVAEEIQKAGPFGPDKVTEVAASLSNVLRRA